MMSEKKLRIMSHTELPHDVLFLVFQDLQCHDLYPVYFTSKHFHFAVAEFARRNGIPFHRKHLCKAFASLGYLNSLIWASLTNFPWSHKEVESAAKNGHGFLVKWLLGHGHDWDDNTLSLIARTGDVQLLNHLL